MPIPGHAPPSCGLRKGSDDVKTAYAVRRPVANSYLVRHRDRKRRRELGVVLLAVLPVAVALLGYVWLNAELLDVGYEVHQLEQSLEELERVQRQLDIELSYLSSPQQARTRATTELGMAPASLNQMIFAEEVR